LNQAKADGSYHKQLQQLAKIQLLVIDDWGLEALKPAQRNDLLEIMDDRHGSSSTVVCSGLMEPDTLMRDNKRQSERCHHESKTNA